MTRSTRLRSSDYQTLLRLLGELAEISPDPLLRRQHALRSLAAALGTPFGLFLHVGYAGPQYRFFERLLVGYEDAPQSLLNQYFTGQVPIDPAGLKMTDEPPHVPLMTSLRRQLVPDADWYRSEHYNDVRRAFHQDDALYTRMLTPAGNNYGIVFVRPRNDRPFTERHRALLHTFNTHAHRLFRLDEPLDASPLSRLAPRLRPVALRFMQGDSVKQAARHLGLSQHTVVQYSKLIHRTFNVSSRSELLLILMRRTPPTKR